MKEFEVHLTVVLLLIVIAITVSINYFQSAKRSLIKRCSSRIGTEYVYKGDTVTIEEYNYFANKFKLSNGAKVPAKCK